MLRRFEYGLNKPTRELIFSSLKKIDRYKSSVLVDTFLVRLGDFSGSGFILISKSVGVVFSQVPLLAIPFAGCVALLGYKIPPKNKINSYSPLFCPRRSRAYFIFVIIVSEVGKELLESRSAN